MSKAASKVWLVTGSGRGLGRHIVEAALAHGDRVAATARDLRTLAELKAHYGEQVRLIELDVTDAAAARAAVRETQTVFGRLDVVVNNAGYGRVAPFEQADAAAFRAQIDANFHGVVNVTRAALPLLRAQRSGHILQISSVGGRTGVPGFTAYQAAKWAVGGFSEALSQELAPLGIRVSVLEPGGMRTDWAHGAGSEVPDILPDYAVSVGALTDLLGQYAGREASDPARVAQVVLKLAYHDDPPLHLLLGSDAVHFCGQADESRATLAARWLPVSLSTDAAAPGPVPELPRREARLSVSGELEKMKEYLS
ncbi:MAG: SDR family NAD(P)-dependent oxidoreductase [Solimonas sp.]